MVVWGMSQLSQLYLRRRLAKGGNPSGVFLFSFPRGKKRKPGICKGVRGPLHSVDIFEQGFKKSARLSMWMDSLRAPLGG